MIGGPRRQWQCRHELAAAFVELDPQAGSLALRWIMAEPAVEPVEQDPEFPVLVYQEACKRHEAKDFAGAIELYQQAIDGCSCRDGARGEFTILPAAGMRCHFPAVLRWLDGSIQHY